MPNDARPRTLSEVAEISFHGLNSFDHAVREFLDRWQTMRRDEQAEALAIEPRALEVLQNAYLAALAEHLAQEVNVTLPAWTEKPERFLSIPYFAGGLQSLKATLLIESPPAFRRRLIFISANALSRPRRDFVPDDIREASNSDV